jgi:hypothetical protein
MVKRILVLLAVSIGAMSIASRPAGAADRSDAVAAVNHLYEGAGDYEDGELLEC